MKYISFIVCLGIFVTLTTVSCKPSGGSENTTNDAKPENDGPRIVYLNIDTLLSGYDMYLNKKSELEEQSKSAEKALTGKIESFQKRIAKFQQEVAEIQQKANTIAPIELKKLEEKYAQQQQNLGKEEEALMKQRDNAAMELEQKLMETQKDLQSKIDVYLEKIADERGFDLVLMKGGAGSVMYGRKSIDITEEVIKALNDEYNAANPKK
ncbi:MAG: OmpH family outer membrane protein [Saprospiraceae bacterium]|nr:OmpH family outer membrane protein [Saprospiraceae bacterium]